MMIKRIDGVTRVLGKSQGYLGLYVRDIKVSCSVNGDETPAMETSWEPTPEELNALNAGGSVVLRVLGTTHPPVLIYVEE